METRQMKVTYYEDKDILYLQILPERPFKVNETKYGFMVCYDWDDPEKIVGFECIDFSLFIPHLSDLGVVPELDMRFDTLGSDLGGVSLKTVLMWAYQKYILKRPVEEIEPVTS